MGLDFLVIWNVILQYIRYLEESGAQESEVRAIYQRACLIHLRDKFRPHLSWAAFEEEKGKGVMHFCGAKKLPHENYNMYIWFQE